MVPGKSWPRLQAASGVDLPSSTHGSLPLAHSMRQRGIRMGNFDRIEPASVRYIKLGEGGVWEAPCILNGTLRFGLETGHPDSIEMCEAGRWEDLAVSWRASHKIPSTATRFTNETRLFYHAGPNELWVTFVGERFYWGFLAPGLPQKHPFDDSTFRVVKDGWRCVDRNGKPLLKSNLPGSITKLASYRATSCWVDVEQAVIRRINAEVGPEVVLAQQHLVSLCEALVPLLQRLGPKDMEVLVELIFGASGWRRIDTTGGTRKLIDLDLELPTTGERAFVQVKTRTHQRELDNYASNREPGVFSRMFYVYHTGNAATQDQAITVIGPEKLARMVLDAGLTDWVIRKAD